MSRHAQTIFHLVPINELAKTILSHPDNIQFVSTSITKRGPEPGLEIGYHVSHKNRPEVLVEAGRNADLLLPSSSVSSVQFSFEVHPESRKIMFHDRSRYHNTEIKPFGFRNDGIFRQVLLQPSVVYTIGAGGANKDKYLFELNWVATNEAAQKLERGYRAAEESVQNHRWARTVDESATEISSWYNTRLHTPANGGVQRFMEEDVLGTGAFGEVIKAVDLDSGCLVAVKKIVLPRTERNEHELCVRREVKTMSSITHKNIVEYLGSSGWGSGIVYIFTSLKNGNINGLFDKCPRLRSDPETLIELLKAMLEALDYLAFRSLLHRDVKPDNILFTQPTTDHYHFQLADFGLAKMSHLAKTHCGTPLFMAPELFSVESQQTAKMDVWSLFVTIICVTRTSGFDQTISDLSHARNLIRAAAKFHVRLSPMAHEDPKQRASAAQMLVDLFDGAGMSTPRAHVLQADHQSRKAANASPKTTAPRNVKVSADEVRKKPPRRTRGLYVPGAFPRQFS